MTLLLEQVQIIRDTDSSFHTKIIELMKLIPLGKVTTYKLLAHALNCRAYRAVGNAVGANPFAPIVPCHRVVKTDGSVGKFGSGTPKKIVLLRQEGIQITGDDESAKILDFANVLFDFH
jgi:methylated-DNA-[protein]-cysteine S-methyltransferase